MGVFTPGPLALYCFFVNVLVGGLREDAGLQEIKGGGAATMQCCVGKGDSDNEKKREKKKKNNFE